jgi:lactoylglutathione lyase
VDFDANPLTSRKPVVHTTPLNHGLWIDDLPGAVVRLTAKGVRFVGTARAPSDNSFSAPQRNDDFPVSGEAFLIELVQAPPEVVSALAPALSGSESESSPNSGFMQ